MRLCPALCPRPRYRYGFARTLTHGGKQKPLGKLAILRGVSLCPDDLKSGRPAGFLDASDAASMPRETTRVYHRPPRPASAPPGGRALAGGGGATSTGFEPLLR